MANLKEWQIVRCQTWIQHQIVHPGTVPYPLSLMACLDSDSSLLVIASSNCQRKSKAEM